MNKFIAEGELPNFARLHRESEVHITEADEDHPYLEPWIQWITVHSGLVSKNILLWPIDLLTQKHYVHHAGNYNNNYASLTPFWDMLFGTAK